MVNASLDWHPFAANPELTLSLTGNNLFDVDARRHQRAQGLCAARRPRHPADRAPRASERLKLERRPGERGRPDRLSGKRTSGGSAAPGELDSSFRYRCRRRSLRACGRVPGGRPSRSGRRRAEARGRRPSWVSSNRLSSSQPFQALSPAKLAPPRPAMTLAASTPIVSGSITSPPAGALRSRAPAHRSGC